MADVMFAKHGCGGCASALNVLKLNPAYGAVDVKYINDARFQMDVPNTQLAEANKVGGVPTLITDIGTPQAKQHIGALAILQALSAKYKR